MWVTKRKVFYLIVCLDNYQVPTFLKYGFNARDLNMTATGNVTTYDVGDFGRSQFTVSLDGLGSLYQDGQDGSMKLSWMICSPVRSTFTKLARRAKIRVRWLTLWPLLVQWAPPLRRILLPFWQIWWCPLRIFSFPNCQGTYIPLGWHEVILLWVWFLSCSGPSRTR